MQLLITIVKKIASPLVILLTVIFLGRTLVNYYEQLRTSDFYISPFRVVASFFLFLGYVYMRAFSWRSLVQFLGEKINKQDGLSVWFFSEATRFIPGNVWSFASRAYLSQKNNLSRNVALLVIPLEIMVVSLVAGVLSTHSLMENLERVPLNLTLMGLAVIPLFGFLGIFLLLKKLNKILSKVLDLKISFKAFGETVLFQFGAWLLYAAGTVVLISSFEGASIPLLLSSTVFAWLIGYLSVITPMGLGVREGAFVLLVGYIIGIPQAVIIAVLSRVLLIFTELTNLSFWLALRRKLS